jgi:hypothetical protein
MPDRVEPLDPDTLADLGEAITAHLVALDVVRADSTYAATVGTYAAEAAVAFLLSAEAGDRTNLQQPRPTQPVHPRQPRMQPRVIAVWMAAIWAIHLTGLYIAWNL